MSDETPVVLITGASTGIGKALAMRWARDGARLVISARDSVELEKVAREATSAGGVCVAEAGDVTKEEDRVRLVERAKSEFGRIDVLVNNAGRGYYAPCTDIDIGAFTDLFALNVVAPLRLTQLAMSALKESRGMIVMMSSIAGVAAVPSMGAYAATKFALEAIAMSMRGELASSGVGVLVVRPGPVDTPFRENSIATNAEAGVRPKGSRAQTPEAVADRTVRAVGSRASVVETSLFVNVGSFASRALPPIFRLVNQRMAAKKS